MMQFMHKAGENMSVDVYEFMGDRPGPTLTVMGGVHGDEPCGTEAINRLMEEIRSGKINLEAGVLVCVPLANPPARARGVRFIDRNLNRIFGDSEAGIQDTEGPLAEAIKPLLRQTDYLLDIHSYSASGAAFTFAEDGRAALALSAVLPSAVTITGFQDCYRKAFPDRAAPPVGTTEYARDHGAVSVTYECGQHRDPRAPLNGYNALCATLVHTGLVAAGFMEIPAVLPAPHIRLETVFIKTRDGRFEKPWKHLDSIRAGEVFARFEDGEVQYAQQDSVIVLPKENASLGAEWGYLGVLR